MMKMEKENVTNPNSLTRDYLKYEFRKDSIDLYNKIMKENDLERIDDLFSKSLLFGTAGLRAEMYPVGWNRMNVLTVLQCSQAVSEYCFNRLDNKEYNYNKTIVIGYDARHNSKEFAEFAAAPFLVNGFEVYLYSTITPTPYTPYLVKKIGASFGIQITASHNPKADNGYKVYDANGAQIVSPIDNEIQDLRLKERNLKKWDKIDDYKVSGEPIFSHKNLHDANCYIIDYFNDINARLFTTHDKAHKPKVVYTAMHGVGSEGFIWSLELAGADSDNVIVVPEQDEPDPEFTTVKFPNPEEKGALNMAMALADKEDISLIFANDPDADRFAMAEKNNGHWHVFKGDEIGVLFGDILMDLKNITGVPYEKQLVCASAVSSKMLKSIAEKKGSNFEETLTGFKWIINDGERFSKEKGLDFIYGYEEALGYALLPDMIPDKDGVSAGGVMYMQAMKLYKEKSSFLGYLHELYAKYGYFVQNNGYVKCHDKDVINQMFGEWRENKDQCSNKIGKFNIVRKRDVSQNYDTATDNKKCSFYTIPDNMLTYWLDKFDINITIRTSGTEPKIKWYAEGKTLIKEDVHKVESELEELIVLIKSELFQMNKFPVEEM